MNRVTDALKLSDQEIWLRAALRGVSDSSPIVFDSMRFKEDYNFFSRWSFITWRIITSLDLCVERLQARGEVFTLGVDEIHRSETELGEVAHSAVITNDSNGTASLFRKVDELLTGD